MIGTDRKGVALNSMKISVIIPTLNHAQSIAERLKPICSQTLDRSKYEILVVDNGSSDNTAEVLSTLCSQIENLHWIREPRPGRSNARNRGICESSGDLIVFLDDDIEISSDNLERHLFYHVNAKGLIAVISRVKEASAIDPKWAQQYFHVRQNNVSFRAPDDNVQTPLGQYFATGNVSILRNTLELIRNSDQRLQFYFDTDPAFDYLEDSDMGFRLIKAGVQFVFAQDIRCYHNHPTNLQSILKRNYRVGYCMERLIRKYPEVSANARYLTSSRLVNGMLLIAIAGLFPLAYILYLVWPEPLYKVIGGILLYQTNRGYQQALRDHVKEHK